MKSVPCAQCGSKCCKYVTVPINTPSCSQDIDHIRWYLRHKNVKIFISNTDVWHVEFVTSCDYLAKDGLCADYDNRPDICRDYGTGREAGLCEYIRNPYKQIFSDEKEFERWCSRDRALKKLL